MTAGLDWTKLHGRALEGGYEVQELLAADQAGRSFKIRVLGDSSAHAVMRVLIAEGAVAEEQIALWNGAKSLQHPNLITPLTAGQTEIDGVAAIYVILPRADEALDSVLSERPLAEKEADEVLLSASQALDYLHARGFVHGGVSPRQILAVGESVKLSTESIRKIGSDPPVSLVEAKYVAPESSGENVNPEADVWCLGATIFEALTQRECRDSSRREAAELPGVFGSILPRCLDPDPVTRCKTSHVAAIYKRPETSPRAPVQVPAGDTPIAPQHIRRPAEVPSRQNRKLWIYAALALVLLVALIWALRPKHKAPYTATIPPPASASAAPTPAPVPPTPAPASQPAAPVRKLAGAPNSYALATKPARPKQTGTTVKGPIWRVVLYTYGRAEDARNMTQSLNQKHRQLNAEVFSPEGQKSVYLVVAGGKMNYEQAVRLRRRVLSMGLPRDAYIQNYRD